MNQLLRQVRRHGTKVARPKSRTAPDASPPSNPLGAKSDPGFWWFVAVLAAIAFVWAYWATLGELVHIWSTQPDYSHGFLVVPVGIYLLWARRQHYPGLNPRPAWLGIGLIMLSIASRGAARLYFLEALDAWSIMLWCGGMAWLLGGWPMIRWSWPAIAFLFFMVPLPFRLEQALTLPLQGFATVSSCFVLQSLGQPALAEGHTIWLGEHRFEIEEACAGLRIFVGITALAFAYAVLTRRGRWERALLLVSAIPVALAANAIRIVATGLLLQLGWTEAARKLGHDLAGWFMIPLAMLLFWLLLWYGNKLVPLLPVADVRQLVHRRRSTALRGTAHSEVTAHEADIT